MFNTARFCRFTLVVDCFDITIRHLTEVDTVLSWINVELKLISLIALDTDKAE